MRRHRHLGVYALAIADDQVLLIRKARGPYTGSWDLPGGGIEFGESPEDALQRELIEETNLVAGRLALAAVEQIRLVHTLPSGEQEDLQHIGLIYRVELDRSTALRAGPDGIDSLGARWLPLRSLDGESLSPFAARSLGRVSKWDTGASK